jgi:outer membrane murein-binding lipoprotein Lpp
MGVGEIFSIALRMAGTLVSIFSKLLELHNSPEMVKAKMAQLHQDLKDHEAKIDKIAADPNATPEDHQKALDAIRLGAS